MPEDPAPTNGAAATLAAFIDLFGSQALDLCSAVADRMALDSVLAARVSRRHVALAAAYAESGEATTLSLALAAGQRAFLVVLLLESDRRFLGA